MMIPVSAGLAALSLLAGPPARDRMWVPEIPDALYFRSSSPFIEGDDSSFQYHFLPIEENPDGERRLGGATIYQHYLKQGRPISPPRIGYMPLREGDVVPMLNHLFRVGTVGTKTLVAKRLKHSEVPAKWAIRRDSFIIPRKGMGTLWGCTMSLDAIEVPAKGGKNVAVLRLKIGVPLKDKSFVARVRVKEGDWILLYRNIHQVRRVVAADPKIGIAGWVEFGADPIREADFLRFKMPLVRPEKAK